MSYKKMAKFALPAAAFIRRKADSSAVSSVTNAMIVTDNLRINAALIQSVLPFGINMPASIAPSISQQRNIIKAKNGSAPNWMRINSRNIKYRRVQSSSLPTPCSSGGIGAYS